MKTVSTAIKHSKDSGLAANAPTGPEQYYPELRLTGDAAKAVIEQAGETGTEVELTIKAKIVSKQETSGSSKSYRPDEVSVELEIISIGDEEAEEEMGEEMGGSAEDAIGKFRASRQSAAQEADMD